MIKTEICDLLNIEYPIIQGGMAWVATAELASAVSETGGLGILGLGNMTPDLIRNEIRKTKEMTTKPFGVNIYFLSPYVEDAIQIAIEERIPVITTGAGNPGKYVPSLKEAGIKVIPVIAAVALARRLERIGVDAVIAEGMEKGGHIGQVTTMALVPQVVDAVEIPVIAAGGIADGRGLVAALALGAKGVQMGTRFVCATETKIHENYKKKVLKANERDTVITGESIGLPLRALKNKLSREFALLEKSGASKEEIEAFGIGRLRAAVVDGDMERGTVIAGQICGLINTVKPVRGIINDIMTEAEQEIRRLAELI